MTGKKDKGRDVPAHDEYAGGNAYDRGAYRADMAEVFGRKEKRICPVGAHKPAVQGAEEDKPKDQQDLKLFHM